MNEQQQDDEKKIMDYIELVLSSKEATEAEKKSFIDKVLDDIGETAKKSIKKQPNNNGLMDLTKQLISEVCSLARKYGLNY